MDTELEFQNSILIRISADRADTGDMVIEYVLTNKVFVVVSREQLPPAVTVPEQGG